MKREDPRIASRACQAEVATQPGGTRDSRQFQSIKVRLQRMPAPRAMPRS